MRTIISSSLSLLSFLVLSQLALAEHRHHEAHVHGTAELNLVLSKNELQVEFHSPAVNIVGFEHAPASEADNAKIEKVKSLVKNSDSIILITPENTCTTKEPAKIELSFEEQAHEEAEHHHDGGDEEEHEGHSEIAIEYTFTCKDGMVPQSIKVSAFKQFPSLNEVNAQVVVDAGQTARNLTPKDDVINLTELR